MTDREKAVGHLQILRTWCAVNPNFGMGLSAEDCGKAVEWLDDALTLLKAQGPVRCAECKYCVDADRDTPYDGDEEWYCKRWKRYVSAYVVDPYRFYCAAIEKREVRVKDQVCGGDGYGAE